MPRALTVFRLMTRLNFAGCSTVRSPGFDGVGQALQRRRLGLALAVRSRDCRAVGDVPGPSRSIGAVNSFRMPAASGPLSYAERLALSSLWLTTRRWAAGAGPLPQLSLPGGLLGPPAPRDRQDRASPRRAVSAGGLHRDHADRDEPGRRPFLQPAWDGRASIKEGKTATNWTRLSCHRFRVNEVRLLLGVIAYNLGNLLRRLMLPVAIHDCRSRVFSNGFKTGGRLIRHARYFTVQLAESYLTGPLFRQILTRIERLKWDPT